MSSRLDVDCRIAFSQKLSRGADGGFPRMVGVSLRLKSLGPLKSWKGYGIALSLQPCSLYRRNCIPNEQSTKHEHRGSETDPLADERLPPS